VGLFSRLRRNISRSLSQVGSQIQRAAPILSLIAPFIPPPAGLIAGVVAGSITAGELDISSAVERFTGPPRILGLAGILGQQTRTTVGPMVGASFVTARRLPALSAFPQTPAPVVGSPFGAPFQAANFPPSSGATPRLAQMALQGFAPPPRPFLGAALRAVAAAPVGCPPCPPAAFAPRPSMGGFGGFGQLAPPPVRQFGFGFGSPRFGFGFGG